MLGLGLRGRTPCSWPSAPCWRSPPCARRRGRHVVEPGCSSGWERSRPRRGPVLRTVRRRPDPARRVHVDGTAVVVEMRRAFPVATAVLAGTLATFFATYALTSTSAQPACSAPPARLRDPDSRPGPRVAYPLSVRIDGTDSSQVLVDRGLGGLGRVADVTPTVDPVSARRAGRDPAARDVPCPPTAPALVPLEPRTPTAVRVPASRSTSRGCSPAGSPHWLRWTRSSGRTAER